jgi:hypothetical protein
MLLKHIFPGAYFSRSSLWVAAGGLAPLFITRLLPIACFVVLGAAIAPKRGRVQIALLGMLGGIFGWPLGPQYSVSSDGVIFYVTEGSAAIVGAAAGMLLAFRFFKRAGSAGQVAELDPPVSQRPQ